MQNNHNFENLINEKKYQVFLCASRCTFPLSFAKHTWFVLNKKGIITRWEILFYENRGEKSWGHLIENLKPPFAGLTVFPFFLKSLMKIKFKSEVLKCIEGDENSSAETIINFILNTPKTYEYNYKYHLTGPNSNTYTKFIINKFPDLKIKFPWNAFG